MMNNFRIERLQEENAKYKKEIEELHAVIIRTMDYLEVLPNEFAQITRRVVGLREDLKYPLNLPPKQSLSYKRPDDDDELV
jgi:hypothetical protein